jgi:glutathione S-transferase
LGFTNVRQEPATMPPLILVIGNKNCSSWSIRPWWVLRQAGISFEETGIPLCRPATLI